VYELGGFLWKHPYRPVFERAAEGGGMILGSGACFLVLESRDHAAARNVKPLAAVAGVASERSRRVRGTVTDAVAALAAGLGSRPDVVISGATGVKGVTEEEREAVQTLAGDAPVHATGDLTGHMMEAQAPAGVAIAAALVAEGRAGDALVTSVGHWRGEGAVRVTKIA
jgi:3-oxoacyl-[acyl-carrier-protein] synthase II